MKKAQPFLEQGWALKLIRNRKYDYCIIGFSISCTHSVTDILRGR